MGRGWNKLARGEKEKTVQDAGCQEKMAALRTLMQGRTRGSSATRLDWGAAGVAIAGIGLKKIPSEAPHGDAAAAGERQWLAWSVNLGRARSRRRLVSAGTRRINSWPGGDPRQVDIFP